MRFSASLQRKTFMFVVAAFLMIATCLSAAVADDTTASPSKDESAPDISPPTKDDLADKRVVFCKSALAQYTVLVGDRQDAAKVSEPCLRWSNPLGTVKDGILAVYTFGGGRPVAVGQFFHNRATGATSNWINEFAIVASDNVRLMRSGRLYWQPSEYVCKFADVPDAPVPSTKAPLRLTQMRKIAADFSVIDHFGWDDATITTHTLRLMPQPVYRYSEQDKILDGGMFVFALGTDPECNLFIEAYQDEKGSRFRYALAPMSVYQLEARYKDKEVWSIERRKFVGPKCTKYYARMYDPAPDEVRPD